MDYLSSKKWRYVFLECRGIYMVFPTVLSITPQWSKYSDFFCTTVSKKKKGLNSFLSPAFNCCCIWGLVFFFSSHCTIFLACLKMKLRQEICVWPAAGASSALTLCLWASLHRAPLGVPSCTGARMAWTLYPLAQDRRKRTETFCKWMLLYNHVFWDVCACVLLPKTWWILCTCPRCQLLGAWQEGGCCSDPARSPGVNAALMRLLLLLAEEGKEKVFSWAAGLIRRINFSKWP